MVQGVRNQGMGQAANPEQMRAQLELSGRAQAQNRPTIDLENRGANLEDILRRFGIPFDPEQIMTLIRQGVIPPSIALPIIDLLKGQVDKMPIPLSESELGNIKGNPLVTGFENELESTYEFENPQAISEQGQKEYDAETRELYPEWFGLDQELERTRPSIYDRKGVYK